MSASEDRVRDLIGQQAADWFVANRASLPAQERERFADWLKASPMHVEEYLALASLARDLKEACGEPQIRLDALIEAARAAGPEPVPIGSRIPTTSRLARRGVIAALGVLAAVVVGLVAWWSPAAKLVHQRRLEAAAPLRLRTNHGEQQSRRLADGSILHLNTDSEAIWDAAERSVTLLSGEADFEVVHDPRRPFRVVAGEARILDVGTQFDVRLERDSTLITVVEGRVSVGLVPARAGARPSPSLVELRANQQLQVAQGVWPAAPVATDAQSSTSWMRRQITFDHEPLSRVAREFNRYSARPIEIKTPALRDLQISGAFSIDDPDAFVAFLRSLDGVRVEVTATQIIVSRD